MTRERLRTGGARAVARRRRAPRRSQHLRRRCVAARRRQRDPVAGTPWGHGGRLGRNRFRRTRQPRRRRPGPPRRPLRRRRCAGPRAARHGPFGLRRSRLRDGLGVARRAAARQRVRPPRRRARPGGPRPRAAGGRVGQGAQQRPRPACVAAGSGGRRRQFRRHRGRHSDAVRIRLDRNGIPAAVGEPRATSSRPESVAADEVVRVRVLPAWLRIDARFGTVYRRRGDPAVVLR